eukprot:6207947-Pleurochrysis_carterae.AAC.6
MLADRHARPIRRREPVVALAYRTAHSCKALCDFWRSTLSDHRAELRGRGFTKAVEAQIDA